MLIRYVQHFSVGVFGSVRSSRKAYLRLLGSNLSRALNLFLFFSDLHTSFSAHNGYFVRQTEPKILRLV